MNRTPEPAQGGREPSGPIDGFTSAAAMLRALDAREVSAVELLDLHLRRIERFNPALNAIVSVNGDEARRQAEAADGARDRGESLPLLGLPITIKDCIYVRGLATTGGLIERKDAVADADAPVVARLRAAGAVFLGKTNVPPSAADWQSDNPVFGRTNNPWDPTRTPGGSTGGGAAAVAAGLSPIEFGGDLGGSIRVPAAFCGIYGHKPSETAVRSIGHFPGGNVPNAADAMAVQGPLARSAEDLERALDVIAGPEPAESVAWRLELPPARHVRIADYRVAVLPAIPWLPVDDEIGAALEALAGELGRLGATVQETQPLAFGHLTEYFETYAAILAARKTGGRAMEERCAEAESARARGDAYGRGWANGLMASGGDYLRFFGRREAYRAEYRAFFQEWDLLLTPITLTPAFMHRVPEQSDWSLDIGGRKVDYMLQLVYPGLCSLTGQPGTTFPAGRTRLGLPIGLQAIGPYLEDRTPIRFAAEVARSFGGFQRPPSYS